MANNTTPVKFQIPSPTTAWVSVNGIPNSTVYNFLSNLAKAAAYAPAAPGIVVFDGNNTTGVSIVPGSTGTIDVTNGNGETGNISLDVDSTKLNITIEQVTDVNIEPGSILSGISTGTNTGDIQIQAGAGITVSKANQVITVAVTKGVPQVNIIYYTFFGGF